MRRLNYVLYVIQISIRPVWSESSLASWRKLGSLATHWAYSKDSDQTGWMPGLIWVFTGCTCHFVVFVWRLIWCIAFHWHILFISVPGVKIPEIIVETSGSLVHLNWTVEAGIEPTGFTVFWCKRDRGNCNVSDLSFISAKLSICYIKNHGTM